MLPACIVHRATHTGTCARSEVLARGFTPVVKRGVDVQVNADDALHVYDVLRADKILVEAPAFDTIARKFTKLSQDRSSKRDLKKGHTRGSYYDLLAIQAGYTGGKKKPELRGKNRPGGGGEPAATAEGGADAAAAEAGDAAAE